MNETFTPSQNGNLFKIGQGEFFGRRDTQSQNGNLFKIENVEFFEHFLNRPQIADGSEIEQVAFPPETGENLNQIDFGSQMGKSPSPKSWGKRCFVVEFVRAYRRETRLYSI